MRIERLSELSGGTDFAELAALLQACVEAGASIGFLAPLSREDAEVYWNKVAADIRAGGRVVLVARETASGRIVGSAQLALEPRANGRHRAEVQKVMVLPSHRRRGVARALMQEIETRARAEGRSLLFLDTSDSHAGAREFYDALGYTYIGGIPGYALNTQGVAESNAIYYKTLALDA